MLLAEFVPFTWVPAQPFGGMLCLVSSDAPSNAYQPAETSQGEDEHFM